MGADIWRTVTIGSLIDEGTIIVHKDGNHGSNYPRAKEFGSMGVPFLTAKLLDNAGNIDFDNAPRLSYEKATKFKFGFIEIDDVLLSHNATIGRVAVVPHLKERVLIGTSLTHFRLDKTKLLPRYLAAYFTGRKFQNQLAAVMSQTTRNQVPITSQRTLSIVVPPISEQEQIVNILGSLDDKIELNRQINQTLEQIAQTIFKSWFVDFEPVKAKIAAKAAGRDPERAAMCAISGKIAAELDQLTAEQRQQLAATAALFPDKLVESELGLVPLGWNDQELSDICQFSAGSAFKREYQGQSEGEFPFIKVSDMNLEGNEIFIRSAQNYVFEPQRKAMNAKLHPNGATVFAKIGVALLSNRRRILRETTIVDNNMMTASPVGVEPMSCYLYLLLSSIDFTVYANGTALPYLNVSDLKKIQVRTPSKNILRHFNSLINPLFEKIYENSSQSEALINLRDSLLPKLLSGNMPFDEGA